MWGGIYIFDRPISLQFVVAMIASCALAYVIPYDVLFDAATINLPALRAVAMLLCWATGLWLQRANGFSLAIVGLRRPVLVLCAAAIAVAIWCVLLDAMVFRSVLPAGYFSFEREPLSFRLLYFGSRAFNENVLYRFFLGALLAWGLRRIWRRPEQALALSMVGMAAAHLVNVAANMAYAGFDPLTSLWLLLRFGVPGIAWSWLYVRHGFVANEAAAIGVHLVLQPLVTVAI